MELKKNHRYRMSAEVVVTSVDGTYAMVRGVHPESGLTNRMISKYTWEDLGPVLKSGFYKDDDGQLWRYDAHADKWARHVAVSAFVTDRYAPKPAPRFPLRKVEFGDYVYG